MTTLAERLAKSHGRPQEVDGQLVESMYRRSVSQEESILVRRVGAVLAPTQGIRLKVDKGKILVNGQELQDVVLWADSSPMEVDVVCRIAKEKSPTAEFRLWNCWRTDDGVMQAWLGDAGMVIDDGGQTVRIRCSDGTHPFAPTDIEIELLLR